MHYVCAEKMADVGYPQVEELLEEMQKYRLEVLGESKMKMKGNGSKVVGEGRCIFAGVEEGRTKAGVATFLSKRMSESLKEWKCTYK